MKIDKRRLERSLYPRFQASTRLGAARLSHSSCRDSACCAIVCMALEAVGFVQHGRTGSRDMVGLQLAGGGQEGSNGVGSALLAAADADGCIWRLV